VPTFEPTEEATQVPIEEPMIEEPVRLLQIPNTQRRPCDEEQQPGYEVPLERNPLIQED